MPLELVRTSLVSHQHTTEDQTALIGVSGRLQGFVSYGFSDELVRNLAVLKLGRVVSVEESKMSLGDLLKSLSTDAGYRLAELKVPCDYSPWLVVEPIGSKFTENREPQIFTTFGSAIGALSVRIRLLETNLKYTG